MIPSGSSAVVPGTTGPCRVFLDVGQCRPMINDLTPVKGKGRGLPNHGSTLLCRVDFQDSLYSSLAAT